MILIGVTTRVIDDRRRIISSDAADPAHSAEALVGLLIAMMWLPGLKR
jgi:hypothetical protein